MKRNANEKTPEPLPFYEMLFFGKDGASATTTHRKDGIITVPLSKIPELERLVAEKAASPDDPENGLAHAFKLHLKGGDLLQRDFRSYHYSRVCWSLLMREADHLRKRFKLP